MAERSINFIRPLQQSCALASSKKGSLEQIKLLQGTMYLPRTLILRIARTIMSIYTEFVVNCLEADQEENSVSSNPLEIIKKGKLV